APAAGNAASRPRAARVGDSSTSRTAGKTRASLLDSVVARLSQTPPAQRWLIAGSAGAILVAIGLYFGFRGGERPSVGTNSTEQGDGAPKVATSSTKKQGQRAGESAPGENWAPLFPKADLKGWQGLPGLWKAGNGALTGSTGGKRFA